MRKFDRRCSPPVRITRSGSGSPGGVEDAAHGGLVDRLGGRAGRHQLADGIDELGPAGVVEGDVEQQPLPLGRGVERLVDRAAGLRRQLVEPAEQPDADALAAELVGLAPDRRLEQAEQARGPRRRSEPSSRG